MVNLKRGGVGYLFVDGCKVYVKQTPKLLGLDPCWMNESKCGIFTLKGFNCSIFAPPGIDIKILKLKWSGVYPKRTVEKFGGLAWRPKDLLATIKDKPAPSQDPYCNR